MFWIDKKIGSLCDLIKGRHYEQEKEMLSSCIDEFIDDLSKERHKKSKSIFSKMSLEISENERFFVYVFKANGLKEENVNVSFRNEYLTVERVQERNEQIFFNETYTDKSLRKMSSKSYYIAGIDEDNVEFVFSENKLTVLLPKNINK